MSAGRCATATAAVTRLAASADLSARATPSSSRLRSTGAGSSATWSARSGRGVRSAADWFDLYVVPNLAKRTRRDYQALLDRHVIPRLGRLKLRDVSTDVIDRFKHDVERQGTGRSQTRQAFPRLQKTSGTARS